MTVYIMDSLYFESVAKMIPAEFAKGSKMILFYEKGRNLPDCVFEYISKGWITLKLLPAKMQDCIPIVTFELGIQHSLHPENKFILWGDAALTGVFKFFLVYDDNATAYLGIRNILKDQTEVQEKFPVEKKERENGESAKIENKTSSNKAHMAKNSEKNKPPAPDKENRNNKKRQSKASSEKHPVKVKTSSPHPTTDEAKKAAASEIYDAFFDFNMDDEDTAVLVSPSVPKTEKKNINKNKQENKTAENPPRKTPQAKQPTFPTDNHPVEDNQKEKENNISDKVEQTGRFSKNSSEDKKAIKRTDIASNKEVSFESKADTHKKEPDSTETAIAPRTQSNENTVKINNNISAGADLETALGDFLQEECFKNFSVSADEMRAVIMSLIISVDASNIKSGMHLYKEQLEQFLPETKARVLYDKTIPAFPAVVDYFSVENK